MSYSFFCIRIVSASDKTFETLLCAQSGLMASLSSEAWDVLCRRNVVAAEGHTGMRSVSDAWSSFSGAAGHLENAARFSSWHLCWTCASALPGRSGRGRPTGVEVVDECFHCHGLYVVPQESAWPRPLLGLTRAEQVSWRPFVLQQVYGRPGRGFRRHQRLSGLQWKSRDVADSASPRVLEAFAWLMEHCPVHASYIQEHREALRASRGGKWTSSWKLLQPGLEAALWPDLYWCEEYLDTKWAGKAVQHASVKKSFFVKACSAVLDYGLRGDLAHWHYDRHILARFAGRGMSGSSLRWSLQDVPELPYYWNNQRLALTDLQRQLGPADFFVTLAPGAHVLPWHVIGDHARAVTGRRVYRGGVLEALHVLQLLEVAVQEHLLPQKGTGPYGDCKQHPGMGDAHRISRWKNGHSSRTMARGCLTSISACGWPTCGSQLCTLAFEQTQHVTSPGWRRQCRGSS